MAAPRASLAAVTVTEQPEPLPVTPVPLRTVTTDATEHCGAVRGLCRYGATLTVWLDPALSAAIVIGWITSGGTCCATCGASAPAVGVAWTRMGNDSAEPFAATVIVPSPLAVGAAERVTSRLPSPPCLRSTPATGWPHDAVYSTVAGSSPVGSHAWQSRGTSTVRGWPPPTRFTR